MDFRQSTGGKEDISVLIKKNKKALGVVMTFNRYFLYASLHITMYIINEKI
jgi:hypothetical protein